MGPWGSEERGLAGSKNPRPAHFHREHAVLIVMVILLEEDL